MRKQAVLPEQKISAIKASTFGGLSIIIVGSFELCGEVKNLMTNFAPEHSTEEMILVEVSPHDIDFFNKLLEGYDNLALVTTLDAKLGKLALWVAKQAKKDMLAILKCLPVPVHVLDARG